MATQIKRPESAFPLSTAHKRPRAKVENYLSYVRRRPCCICGLRPVEAAHVRHGDFRLGKRETGKGERPDDRWTIPLCPSHHREQHDQNERAFWIRHGLSPLILSALLYSAYSVGDDEAGDLIIKYAAEVNLTWA